MSQPTVSLKDYAARGIVALRDAGIGPPQAPKLPEPKGRAVQPTRGKLNGTEQRYAKRLDNRKLAGEVAWYAFEAIKFRLADGSWYTPDFLVMLSDGTLQIHECKGKFIREAALVRAKVTSETYWLFPVFLVKESASNVFTLRSLDR